MRSFALPSACCCSVSEPRGCDSDGLLSAFENVLRACMTVLIATCKTCPMQTNPSRKMILEKCFTKQIYDMFRPCFLVALHWLFESTRVFVCMEQALRDMCVVCCEISSAVLRLAIGYKIPGLSEHLNASRSVARSLLRRSINPHACSGVPLFCCGQRSSAISCAFRQAVLRFPPSGAPLFISCLKRIRPSRAHA